ncbi:Esterase [Aratus pisonii nudivirus]|nr:Esterase [Aratus pisonii nudivirus]
MLSLYIITTTILSLIFIIILIYLVSIIINPKQPINYLKKHLQLNYNNYPIQDCTSYEEYEYLNIKNYIFYLDKNINTDTIIIDLPGGAFISSCNTFDHYIHMDQPYNIASIEYPVLPNYVYKQSIDYIMNAIQYIIDKYDYKKIILSAASAGCYYAVKIINSEKFKNYIIKFISVSGYFGYKTMRNIGTFLTQKVYLKQYKDKYLDCYPVPVTIETFYAVGEYDNMKISTYEYLKQSGSENQVILYPKSVHCFYLNYNNTITKGFYNDISDFIKN